jgi:hypothetical protein
MEAGASAYMAGNTAGPCPNCGATGTIPDGLYSFIGQTLRIVSTWSPGHRQRLATELAAAKAGPNPRAAAEAAIRKEPDLLGVAQRLLIPRDAGEFWAFVAVLLAAIALLGSQTGDNITVNEETVIENITSEPTPTKPRLPPGVAPQKRAAPKSAAQKAKAKAKRKAKTQARRRQRK